MAKPSQSTPVLHLVMGPPDVWKREIPKMTITSLAGILGFEIEPSLTPRVTHIIYETPALRKAAQPAIETATKLGMNAKPLEWKRFVRQFPISDDLLVELIQTRQFEWLKDYLQSQLFFTDNMRPLRNVDFSGLNLARQSFVAFLRLHDCKFDGAKLNGVELFQSHGCTFRKASMVRVRFGDTPHGCDFTGADLSNSTIPFVHTSKIAKLPIFRNAKMEKAKIDFVAGSAKDARKGIQGVCFDGAQLDRSRFNTLALRNCSFRDASLVGARLRGINFVECDFRGAKLSGADLRDVKIDAYTGRTLKP